MPIVSAALIFGPPIFPGHDHPLPICSSSMKRHPADVIEDHDESVDAKDTDSQSGLGSKLKSISRLPTWKLLVTLCSESLFYVGAWILALYVLYVVSQARVHTRASSRGALDGASTTAVAQEYGSSVYEPGLALADAYTTREAEFEDPKSSEIAGSGKLHAFTPAYEYYNVGKSVNEQRSLLRGASAIPEFPPLFPPLSQPLRSLTPMPSQFEAPSVEPLPVHSSADPMEPKPAIALLAGGFALRTPPLRAPPSPSAHSHASQGAKEMRCRELRNVKGVVPGKSWGKLTKALQNEWMDQKCDQYFCKPHRLEGKGIYKCEPL